MTPDQHSLRIPPHNIEAERGVLGSILLDPNLIIGKCLEMNLTSEEFYDRRHQLFFQELVTMAQGKKAMDAITIADCLKDKCLLEKVGGYEYMMTLQDQTLVSAHSEHYTQIVKEKAEYRRLILKSSEIIDECYKQASDPSAVADRAVLDFMTDKVDDRCVDDIIIEEMMLAIDGKRISLPTPWPSLDARTGGIRKRMKTVVTGRSKAGKSMLLAQWYNYLGKLGIPTMAVPMEDTEEITRKRMAANIGGFKTETFDGVSWVKFNGVWQKEKPLKRDVDLAIACLADIRKYPVYFYDEMCTVEQLYTKAVRYKAKYGIEILFVDGAKDFLNDGSRPEVAFDNHVSKTLVKISKDLNIAVVPVHHLTKVPDGQLITSNNIRGSGLITSDARALYAMQSDGIENIDGVVANKDDEGRMITRVFECISNNHGATGMKVLESDLSRCRFFSK